MGSLSARLDVAQPAAGVALFGLDAGRQAGSSPALGGNLLAGRFLGLSPISSGAAANSPLCDAYVRGPDLIATYGPVPEFPFRWQVYWRAQSERYAGSALAIELVISIQTELLDSRPLVAVASRLSATSLTRRRTGDQQPRNHQPSEQEPGAHEPVGQQPGDEEEVALPLAVPRKFDRAGGIGCYSFRASGGSLDYCEMVHPADVRSSQIAPVESRAGGAQTELTHQLFTDRLEKGVILRSRLLGLFLLPGTTGAMIADSYRSFVAEELPLTT